MWYLAIAIMVIALGVGVVFRKGGAGYYLAMLGIIAGAVMMFFANGCSSQPPPAPAPVVVQAPPPKPQIPPDPYASLPPDVVQAIKHNQTPTLQHGITVLQPYSPDLQYPLLCAPLHVTQIQLREDEVVTKDDVKIGDRDRWGTIVGDHSVKVFPLGSNVPITVPGAQITIPPDPNMVTNLAISTSAGNNYTFDPIKLVKPGKPFTERVQFYYPDWTRQLDAQRQQLIKQEGQQ